MCVQNMLMEIEQKVLCLSELSVHSESLLLEGKAGMRGDAEQLTLKLHSLKASLLELQRILQDKHTHIQVSVFLTILRTAYWVKSWCLSQETQGSRKSLPWTGC